MAKTDEPYSKYPLITETEHEELNRVGKGPFPKTLNPQRGEELEREIDARIEKRRSHAKIITANKATRRQHHSYKYTSSGRRAAKRSATKP